MKKRVFNSVEQDSRRIVFRIMYEIGLIDNTLTTSDKMVKINSWIAMKTNFKEKGLNDLSINELKTLINKHQAVKRRYLEQQSAQAGLN
jgi:hypothetical protein